MVELTINRDLCQKLVLKAESQEIDRIIEGFSTRYYECNPGTVYGAPGECHEIILPNTDLRQASYILSPVLCSCSILIYILPI